MVAQPIASLLDVDNMRAMEQAVEDGGRQYLVIGLEFGPVADDLVGRNDHGSASVSIADQPEEQASIFAVQSIVAHLVAQQQRAGHELPAFKSNWRKVGICALGGQQLIKPEIPY